MNTTIALGLALGLAVCAPAQDVLDEAEVEITTADEGDVKVLLARHRDALAKEDAIRIGEALAAMSGHDNLEFLTPALAGLGYRGSKLDKREARAQAKELGTVSKKAIDAFLALREAEVQVAAAHVLANYPGQKKVSKALAKAFADKKLRKAKPTVTAALITALGKLGHDKLEKDMLGEITQATDKHIARAAVRYFGQIKTTDYSTVRKLCELLSSPQPGDVNGATNPPAGYWQAQWEVWSWTRRDVTWSLQQITGQVFRPEDGDDAGDSRKALEFVKKNKRQLGLR